MKYVRYFLLTLSILILIKIWITPLFREWPLLPCYNPSQPLYLIGVNLSLSILGLSVVLFFLEVIYNKKKNWLYGGIILVNVISYLSAQWVYEIILNVR